MENNNSYFERYSGYEVALSRKGKRNRRQRTKQFTSPQELKDQESQNLESAGESNGNQSELECDGMLNNLASPEVIDEYRDGIKTPTVYRDGMMFNPPNYGESSDKLADKLGDVYVSEGLECQGPIEVTACGEEAPVELNTRALFKTATTYELEKFEKNALIIFNQENVEGHKMRLGTEKDVTALTRTFENFGFEVVEHKDLTKDEIFRELKTFSERNFTDYGCVGVAVLTHGSSKGFLRAKDMQYNEVEIINYFKVLNKPTLVTKPKIVIIQACRGKKIMPGVFVLQSQMGRIQKDQDEDLEPYILPVESDILVLHSSYGGSPSHRDELDGSWYIQELCSKINSLSATHDLQSIITEVNREVAISKEHEEYNRRTCEWDINKQMPVMTSTLIRQLFLRKYGEVQKETFSDKRNSVSYESRNRVLDSSVPGTPLLVQFGPCSCFLEHFNYMRNCLLHFIDENPNDVTAKALLEVTNAFDDGINFNTAKEKMSKAISEHLRDKAHCYQYYKYLYFYKNQ